MGGGLEQRSRGITQSPLLQDRARRSAWHQKSQVPNIHCVSRLDGKVSLGIETIDLRADNDSRHRWAVTATPIPNSVEEFYPYFKFLQIKETGTFKTFKSNFCNPDDKACTRRLHAMLQQWMIRRLKSDTLLGAPIIKLPPSHQTTVIIDFNAVERIIYDKVYNRYIRAINTLVAISGSVKANFDTLSRLSRSGKLEESVNLLLVCLNRIQRPD